MIARTLGARVYANHIKEIGWYDVSPSADADLRRELIARPGRRCRLIQLPHIGGREADLDELAASAAPRARRGRDRRHRDW